MYIWGSVLSLDAFQLIFHSFTLFSVCPLAYSQLGSANMAPIRMLGRRVLFLWLSALLIAIVVAQDYSWFVRFLIHVNTISSTSD